MYIFRNVKSDCSSGSHVPAGFKIICRQHFVKITLKAVSEKNVVFDEPVKMINFFII